MRTSSIWKAAVVVLALTCSAVGMKAQDRDNDAGPNDCASLPNHAALKTALDAATATETSGLNNQMWATIVDRSGILRRGSRCAVAWEPRDLRAEGEYGKFV
jgi:hypothetical protein